MREPHEQKATHCFISIWFYACAQRSHYWSLRKCSSFFVVAAFAYMTCFISILCGKIIVHLVCLGTHTNRDSERANERFNVAFLSVCVWYPVLFVLSTQPQRADTTITIRTRKFCLAQLLCYSVFTFLALAISKYIYFISSSFCPCAWLSFDSLAYNRRDRFSWCSERVRT